MIYLLAAGGLTPGGSSTVHIYTKTIRRTTQITTHRTTQLTTNWEECGPCPIFAIYEYILAFVLQREPGSVVGIATRYGLEGPGIESRWGEIFRTYPDRLQGPPSLLYKGSGVFPGGKGGRGMMLTTHPLLVPKLRKSWAIIPITLWVLLGLLRGSLFYLPYNWGKSTENVSQRSRRVPVGTTKTEHTEQNIHNNENT
jgi:hypothetical protein